MAGGTIDEVGVGTEAVSIAELYDRIEGALAQAFPKRSGGLWVRGEIQQLSDRTGHCYLDLVDPDSAGDRQAPVLKVKCWRNTWGPLKASMAGEGIELAPGMVVVIRGSVDFYRPRAEVGFILTELDVTALLGRLAAQRAALIRALSAEGLLERNAGLAVPAVPLRVGLVASPGTEGYRDFVGQLTGSGFAFHVQLVPVTVQGAEAPAALAAALGRVASSGCQLVAVVRGGGSKADLAAFDAEPVARAIAAMPVPVWTGIGHTGDESVADLVANRSFITPTECGRELAQRVSEWWEERVAAAGSWLGRRAAEVVYEADRRDTVARSRLVSTARHQLRAHEGRVVGRVDILSRRAPQLLVDAESALRGRAGRVAPFARGHLARAGDRLEGWRRLLTAYDVDRQLERGYTLTLDQAGRAVRSAGSLEPGGVLTTRFADGAARSTVTEIMVAAPAAANDGAAG